MVDWPKEGSRECLRGPKTNHVIDGLIDFGDGGGGGMGTATLELPH